jgi:hypothetical protein
MGARPASTSTVGAFRATFPTAPTPQTRVESGATIHLFLSTVDKSSEYGVLSATLPADAVPSQNPQRLNAAISGDWLGAKATNITPTQTTTIDGLPAREGTARITGPGGSLELRALAVIKGQKLYLVEVGLVKDSPAAWKRFRDSFEPLAADAPTNPV